VRPLMFQVFQISTTAQAKRHALKLLFPFGSMIELFSQESSPAVLEGMSEVLLQPIKDASFTCFAYYIPLLEAKTVAGAKTAQLESWLTACTAYIRESFEDKGVLIVSRNPLGPLLETLGGRFETEERPVWYIPG